MLQPYLPPKCEYIIMVRTCERQNELYKFYLNQISSAEHSEGMVEEKRHHQVLPDYHMLYRIWTHPYILVTHQREADEKVKHAYAYIVTIVYIRE